MKKINNIIGLTTLCASSVISGSAGYVVSNKYSFKKDISVDEGGNSDGSNNGGSVTPKPPVSEITESTLNSITFNISSWDPNNFSVELVKNSINKNSIPSNFDINSLNVKLSSSSKIKSLYSMGYYPFQISYPSGDGSLITASHYLSKENNEYSAQFNNPYTADQYENDNWNKYLEELNSKSYSYSLLNTIQQSLSNNNFEYYYYSPKYIIDNIFDSKELSSILAASDVVIEIQNYSWSEFENKNNGINMLNFIFAASSKSLNKKITAQIGFSPDYSLGIQKYIKKMQTSNLIYKEIVSSYYKINMPAGKLNLTAFVTYDGGIKKYQLNSKNDYEIKVDLTEFKS